jgi:hypothetical protein
MAQARQQKQGGAGSVSSLGRCPFLITRTTGVDIYEPLSTWQELVLWLSVSRGTVHGIGPVSKTIAKEILAKKKAEAVEGRYELPSKKPSPLFENIAIEYLKYYQANRRPKSLERHQMTFKAL